MSSATLDSTSDDPIGAILSVSEVTGPWQIPVSARWKVLENLDILENIFSFFQVPPPSFSNRPVRIPTPDSQYLLWMSLVKKSFFDPVMNILWRSMDSWETILHLIPTLVLEDGVYVTTESIHEEHLERMKLYTRRIRHFYFTPPGVVSPDIHYFLSQKLDAPFFPTLQRLDFGDIQSAAVGERQFMFFCPSPSVSEVTIGGIAPSTVGFSASLLEISGETAKKVNSLKLSGESVTTSAMSRLLESVKHFQALWKITLEFTRTSISKTLLESLSNIPTLLHLYVLLDTQAAFISSTDSVLASPDIAFSALTVLIMRGTMTTVRGILDEAEYPKACQVVITLLDDQSAPEDAIQRFIERIVHKTGRNLWNVIIVGLAARNSTSEALPLFGSCKQLRHITIERCSLTLGTLTALRNLCRDLPTLQSLKIDWPYTKSPGFTLSALGELVEQCPTLRVLHLPVAIAHSQSGLDILSKMVKEKPLGHRLTHFVIKPLTGENFNDDIQYAVVCRGIKNAIVVARFIHALFPFIEQLDLQNVPHAEAGWKAGVEAMVKSYQEVSLLAKEAAADSPE